MFSVEVPVLAINALRIPKRTFGAEDVAVGSGRIQPVSGGSLFPSASHGTRELLRFGAERGAMLRADAGLAGTGHRCPCGQALSISDPNEEDMRVVFLVDLRISFNTLTPT